MPTFRPNEKQYDNVRNPDTGLYEHDLKLPGHLLYPDNPLHRHHPLQPSGMMRGSEVGYEKEFPPAYPPFPGLQDWGEYGTGSQLIAEVDYERDLVLNTTYNNQDNDIVRKEKLARLYSDEHYGDINAMDLYRSDYLHDRFMSEWYNYNHIPDTPTPRLIPGVFYNLRRDQTSTISWVHSGTVLGAKELLWQNYSGEAHGDSPEPTPEGCGYSKVGINIASGEIRMSLLRTYVKIDLRQFITRDPLGIVNPFININFNDMKFRVQTPTDGQALSLSSRAVGRAYYITSPGSYILVYYENQAFVSTSHWMDTDGNNLTILSEEPVLYTPGSIMEWTLTETAIDLFRQRLQDVMENPLMFNTFFIIGIVVSKYDYSQEDIYPGEQLMLGDDSTFETIGNWAKHELEPSTASVTGGNYDSEEHPHCLRLLGDSSIDTDFSAIFILDSHLQYPIRSGNTILITFDYKWIVDPEQAHANDPLIFFETFLSSVHIDNDHFGCYQELFADPPFGSKEVLPRLSNGWSHDWNRMTKFDTLGVTVPSSEWLENIWTYLGVNFDPRWSHHILITPWVDDFHGHAVLTEPVDPVEVLIDNFRLYNCWDIPTTIISDPNNDEYDGFWWQGGYCFMNPNLVLSVVEPHIPIVITENHIFESDNYVKLGGWVKEDYHCEVTDRGIIYKKESPPELGDGGTTDISDPIGGKGHYHIHMVPDVLSTYYYQAYAANSEGWGYGEIKSFYNDVKLPVVKTHNPSGIGFSIATGNGEIVDASNTFVTYGSCYNLSSLQVPPTINDDKTIDGQSPNPHLFVSRIDGLNPDTQYSIRAYGTNIKGTAYGEIKTFKTKFAFLPFALLLVFNGVGNASLLVEDFESVSAWNTFFDLPNQGGVFTELVIYENSIALIGGSSIVIKSSLFSGNQDLIKVIDYAGCIGGIMDNAFLNCINLYDAYFPNVTFVNLNGFNYCSSLVSGYFPMLIFVGEWAFAHNTLLHEFTASVIEEISDWGFYECFAMEEFNFPVVTLIRTFVFYHCISTTRFDFPLVEDIGENCFEGCVSANYFNLASCTNLGGSVLYNSVFKDIPHINHPEIIVPEELYTCNDGKPDGDLQDLLDLKFDQVGTITINKVITGEEPDINEYGYLYNWYAVGNIAGSGWHVPTSVEFATLLITIDPDGDQYANDAGGHLKEAGTDHWNDPNQDADNSSGFNARGNGYRIENGIYSFLKNFSYLWNADLNANDPTLACCSILDYSTGYFSTTMPPNGTIGLLKMGMAIRLVCDSSTDPGSYTGNDGKVYSTVKIGNQVWMSENLMETLYNDLSPIPEVTDNTAWSVLTTDARCNYDNIVYEEGDTNTFHVTVTGQSAFPYIANGYISQQNPIVLREIPFDTYTIVESESTGYDITSMVVSPVTVDDDNLNVVVTITNVRNEETQNSLSLIVTYVNETHANTKTTYMVGHNDWVSLRVYWYADPDCQILVDFSGDDTSIRHSGDSGTWQMQIWANDGTTYYCKARSLDVNDTEFWSSIFPYTHTIQITPVSDVSTSINVNYTMDYDIEGGRVDVFPGTGYLLLFHTGNEHPTGVFERFNNSSNLIYGADLTEALEYPLNQLTGIGGMFADNPGSVLPYDFGDTLYLKGKVTTDSGTVESEVITYLVPAPFSYTLISFQVTSNSNSVSIFFKVNIPANTTGNAQFMLLTPMGVFISQSLTGDVPIPAGDNVFNPTFGDLPSATDYKVAVTIRYYYYDDKTEVLNFYREKYISTT